MSRHSAWRVLGLGGLIAALFALVFGHREPRHFDPAFLRLSPFEMARLPLATRFDSPLGSEHAALTYNAQSFRLNRHLGDDLNGIGGLNSDLGDPVYAAATGRVIYAGTPSSGWGNMVILAHRVADLTTPGETRVYQTVYAHLETIKVRHGDLLRRGEMLGTVGSADGQYLAHLHFEIREGPYANPSVGYADAPLNRVSPELFLQQHRGAPADQLHPAPRP